MISRYLAFFVLVLWLPANALAADSFRLNRTRIVKTLATKTPYAYMLDGITPVEDLVSAILSSLFVGSTFSAVQ